MIFPVILGGITSPFWGWLIDRTSPVAGRVAFALMGIPAYFALFASFYFDWLFLAFLGAALRGVVLGAAEVSTTTGNLYFADKPERAALLREHQLCLPGPTWHDDASTGLGTLSIATLAQLADRLHVPDPAGVQLLEPGHCLETLEAGSTRTHPRGTDDRG